MGVHSEPCAADVWGENQSEPEKVPLTENCFLLEAPACHDSTANRPAAAHRFLLPETGHLLSDSLVQAERRLRLHHMKLTFGNVWLQERALKGHSVQGKSNYKFRRIKFKSVEPAITQAPSPM